MTVLNDRSLRAALTHGDIVVRPLAENATQPNSIDVRLGRLIRIPEFVGERFHDLIDDGPLHLSQFRFVLGATLEWIEIADHLTATIEGKSTRARQGLILESAGRVDAGWRGELTLEMFNLCVRPVVLTHGMTIGQIVVQPLTSRAERPYGSDGLGSHYQCSQGPVLARLDGAL